METIESTMRQRRSLCKLERRFTHAMVALGFTTDEAAFTPHVKLTAHGEHARTKRGVVLYCFLS
jgi:2'-5' RNA ligase